MRDRTSQESAGFNFSRLLRCSVGLRGTLRCCGDGFAEQVARNVWKREAPTLYRERLEIGLDENLDGLGLV